MRLRDALNELLKTRTKYRVAKELEMASAVSISNWLRGSSKISVRTAAMFWHVYKIKIDEQDIHDPIFTPNRTS